METALQVKIKDLIDKYTSPAGQGFMYSEKYITDDLKELLEAANIEATRELPDIDMQTGEENPYKKKKSLDFFEELLSGTKAWKVLKLMIAPHYMNMDEAIKKVEQESK